MRPQSRPAATNRLESVLGKLTAQSSCDSDSTRWRALFDVKESPKELTILVDLPGVDEDEISIEAKTGAICIWASREFDHDNEDAEEYRMIGRPYGAFHCEVPVPETAQTEEMTAKYKRGVLRVNVPVRRPKC